MKKIVKILTFTLFPGLVFANQGPVQVDRIVANTDVVFGPCKPAVNLELQPTNPQYRDIEKEFEVLKNANFGLDTIDLDIEQNQNLAPILFQIIREIVERLSKDAGIDMPRLALYVGNSEKTYNASATNAVRKLVTVTTVTKGKDTKQFTDEKYEKSYTLTLGEGLVRLLLWNVDGQDLLAAIIAHEVGHMHYCHMKESKESEYQADAKAAELLKDRASKLMQGIDMVTLGGHVYNVLTGNAALFKLSINDINHLIRIIVSNLIKEFSDLGDLGKSSSHTKFGYVMNKVFQDALQGSFDEQKGLTEENLAQIYEKFEQACGNCVEFMGSEEDYYYATVQCKYVEDYSSKFYSSITHPTPLERRSHLNSRIASL